MNKDEFISKISDIIDSNERLCETSVLDDIEEWDSIAIISTVALFDSLGIKITSKDLKEIKTMSQLIKLAGINE